MIFEDNPIFEIIDCGFYIRITAVELCYPNAESDWDRNWIACIIEIKLEHFFAQYNAAIITTDFEKFNEDFRKLYDNLDGIVTFYDREGYLKIKIIGDGIGHFAVKVLATDEPGSGINASLKCEFNFDQTQIPEMVSQLQNITAKFPKTGNLL